MAQRPHPSTMSDRVVESAWHDHRDHVHHVAARVLGDHAAAEDAVQEAFSRLGQTDVDGIDDVRGWLTVVVRRLAIDRLRSAEHRHTSTTEVTSTDPPQGTVAADPLDRITLDDEVRHALGVMLDRLTPPERTAFVLHDVFGFPFIAVGEIVGRSPSACRQLASRARRSLRSGSPPPKPAVEELHQLAERFVAACEGGDLAGLIELLDPAIEGTGTEIGRGRLGHFRGRRAVARGLLRFIGPGTGTILVPVAMEKNLAVVVFRRGQFTAVVQVYAADGRIRELHSYVRFEGETAPS